VRQTTRRQGRRLDRSGELRHARAVSRGVSSLGGGGTTLLTIIALIVGIVGVVLGLDGTADEGAHARVRRACVLAAAVGAALALPAAAWAHAALLKTSPVASRTSTRRRQRCG
jgi:hypothetical protein